jgi:hypothetical protein
MAFKDPLKGRYEKTFKGHVKTCLEGFKGSLGPFERPWEGLL